MRGDIGKHGWMGYPAELPDTIGSALQSAVVHIQGPGGFVDRWPIELIKPMDQGLQVFIHEHHRATIFLQ